MDFGLFEFIPTGLLVMDRRTNKTVYFNSALNKLLPDFNNDKTWYEYFNPSEAERILDSMRHQLDSTSSFEIECRVKGKNSNAGWIMAVGTNVEDNGRSLLFISISDITYEKEISESLNEKVTTLEMINESVPGGILIFEADDNYTISYANHGFYELVGYTKYEMREFFLNSAFALITKEDLPVFIDDFKRQLQTRDKFHIETQFVKKSGEHKWVSIDGIYNRQSEGDKIYAVIVDITERVRTYEQLKKEQQHSGIILGLADDILFDYDLQQHSVSFSGNFTKRISLPKVFGNFPQSLFDYGILSPASLKTFSNLIKKMNEGITEIEPELEFIINNESIWHRVSYRLIHGSKGEPVRAIGKMTDVTEQKKRLAELIVKAERDALTKLYNKEETQDRIKRIIASESQSSHALLLVDIDNFKGVNDTLGHHFGDTVLIDIAGKIGALFNGSDIAGRIGGDEFAVFIRNYGSIEEIEAKAAELADAFRRTFSGEKMDYKISGSIGIALYPTHGRSFKELYTRADLALYESKHRGKDCYTLYRPDMEQHGRESKDAAVTENYISDYYADDLIFNIFEMLYETKDLYTTINAILSIVGRRYGLDYCCIYQNKPEMVCTYEWRGNHEAPDYIISQEGLNSVFSSENSNGYYYCNDTSECYLIFEGSAVKSCVICQLQDKGNTLGYSCFSQINAKRTWKGEEVAELNYISKILTLFIKTRI